MLGCLKNAVKELFWRIRNLRCRQCPGLDLSGTFVILAPHPDDEVLGCGGLIARLCAEGNPPYVVIMTGGGGSLRGHSDMSESEVVEARRKLTLASARELGLPKENIHFLDFTDGSIADRLEKETTRLKELITQLQPSTILVPHSGEGWPDHLVTRELGLQLAPKDAEVYEYCVWMWYYNVWNLDWKNARKIEMTDIEHAAKLRAVNIYVSAKAPNGDPWSGFLPKPFLRANTSRRELYFLNQ